MLKHFLASVACGAIIIGAMAQPVPAQDVAETRALLVSIHAAMDKQQAALKDAIRDATARNKWSDHERARFLETVVQSATNADFEKQITALLTEMRGMLQASQRGEIRGPQDNERYVSRMRQLARALNATYGRQSVYLLGQLRNAK